MSKDLGNLKAMIDSLDKIFRYSKDIESAEALYNNEPIFDAVLMNFIVIGESVSRFDDEFKTKFSEVPWREVKGLRNIVAHNYFGVDPEEIWDIIQNHLVPLKEQIKSIIEKLEEKQ